MAHVENRHRAVLAYSGVGSTVGATLEAKLHNQLEGIEIVGLMASNSKPDTGSAFKKNLHKYTFLPKQEIRVINPYSFKMSDGKTNDRGRYGDEIVDFLDETGATAIVMLGNVSTMPRKPIEKVDFAINLHPGSLDPGRIDTVTKEQLDYGGKGMRGRAVSAARIADIWATGKDYWTETTVHYVTPDEQLDKGRLISTRRLDISWAIPSPRGWTKGLGIGEVWTRYQEALRHAAKEVQEALLPLEHQNVIAALKQFENGRIPKGFMREDPLINPGQGREYTLFRAKDLAIQIFPKG